MGARLCAPISAISHPVGSYQRNIRAMQNSPFQTAVLCISGLVAIAISSMILTSPVDFYAANHIAINGDINLLSEIRAPATALFAIGILMLTGAFMSQLTFTATILSTVVYLSYGLSRVASMVIDGIPTHSLIWASVVEVILGMCGFILLMALSKSRSRRSPEGASSPIRLACGRVEE